MDGDSLVDVGRVVVKMAQVRAVLFDHRPGREQAQLHYEYGRDVLTLTGSEYAAVYDWLQEHGADHGWLMLSESNWTRRPALAGRYRTAEAS